jgi:hypothetical protein
MPKISDFYKNALGAEFPEVRINNFIFGAYCLSLFSTNNQYSVVTVMNEFVNPTEKRVNMVGLTHAVSLLGNNHPSCHLPVSLYWRLSYVR